MPGNVEERPRQHRRLLLLLLWSLNLLEKQVFAPHHPLHSPRLPRTSFTMFNTCTSINKKRRYELQDIIGHGGFSTVYRAIDKQSGRDVAIKVTARTKDAEHEATISRDLAHPHIISLLDSFTTRKHLYLVYELLSGKELFDHIVRLLPFPLTRSLLKG